MLSRIRGSLAFRLPRLYRILLRFKKNDVPGAKSRSSIVVTMMTGAGFIEMTRLSILSIANTWDALPKLIINTDGTMSADAIRRVLNFWPAELLVEEWQATENYQIHKGRKALVNYARLHPFGKKLALILRHAEQGPVLWIDSDILFFNNFTPFIPALNPGFACGGTEDFISAYHEAVIKITGNNLYERYSFNAGLLYVCGENIYENFDLEYIIKSIHPNYDFLSEQTIFAHLASKSMGILWPLQVIKSYNTDAQEIKAMSVRNVIARHYTSNVRHLFWRDAFFRL